VLHEINMALHADRLVLVADGRIAHEGPSDSAATHRALERVFDGRIAVHPVGRAWVALPVEDLACS
jgi:iron complex transport system ATP-binding protein